jgi:hypothetical protein
MVVAIHNLDKEQPLRRVAPMNAIIGSTLAYRELVAFSFASFSALALALAAVGVSGVISY